MTTVQQTLKVLIAEDNDADVFLIKQALKEHGLEYHAEVASDGEQMLALLLRFGAGSEMMPDLILLDLNLRTHHGTEILAKIRSMPDLKHVPVVVLTSSDSPRDREQVERLGANLYIRKPMDLATFLRIGERIATVLNPP